MPYIPPENELDYIIDEDENEEELELLDDDDNENEADYTSYDYDGPNDIGVPDPNTSGGTPASEEEEETKYVVTYKDRALITSAEPAYLYELFQSGATFYAIYDDDTEEEVSWDEIEDLNPIDTLVDLGEAIASATNQHFWNDDNGVHVAEINKESWQTATESNFSDLSSSKNYYNLLTNSLGLLFRRALYNLVSITRTSISFYDGTGNQSSNVMAYFGRDSAQIGRSNSKHLSLDSEGITAYNADGTVAPIQAANISAAEANIEQLQAATADISTIRANSAKVASLTAEALTAATAYIAALNTLNVTANDISANKATINSLVAGDVTADTIRAASAYVAALTSASVTANDISANKATLGALIAGNVTTDTLRAASAYISALTTSNISASTITADHANVTTIIADYLTSADIQAEQIRVGQLLAGYVETDFSNADVAWIENGTIKDGAITNAMINSVSANKLTAGTIDASNITVTNLNADNITTGTINGQRIGEGSLSLSKLEDDVYTESEVDSMLSAMQAEIDGAIETWTGTAVPTLNNTPASGWTTNAIKDTHVGDVYFVVNSQSQQNGYNYRFTKSGSGNSATYSWQLIKDNDVTNALQRLTTAEGKITTFDSDISQLKTDTGSLTTRTTTLETRADGIDSTLLDKVDVTDFNSLEDTVDGHTQTLSQHTTAISNKADSSTVTAVTNRVSQNEQNISGITTRVGSLETTVATKADSSTVTTVSNNLSTLSQTVDSFQTTVASTYATKTELDAESSARQDVESMIGTLETPYTEVEWVESDGKEFIQLDWIPQAGAGFEVDFQIVDTSFPTNYIIFGCRDGSAASQQKTNREFSTWKDAGSQGTLRWAKNDNGYGTYSAKMYTDGRRQQCSLIGDTYTAPDGSTTSVINGGASPAWGMTIFAGSIMPTRPTTYGGLEYWAKVRIYSLKFYEGNTLAVDLIGAVRKSDGVPGLYDKVSDKFWACRGLSHGPSVQDLGELTTVYDRLALSNVNLSDKRLGNTRLWIADAPMLKSLEDGQQITIRTMWGTANEAKATDLAKYTDSGTSSNGYLKLTLAEGTTEWIPLYYGGTTRLTSHYGAGQDVHFTYRENVTSSGSYPVPRGWWADANYYSDTNTVSDPFDYAGLKTGPIGVWANCLCMENGNGTLEAIVTAADGVSTVTVEPTKIVNPHGFKVGGNVFMSSSAYSANSNISGQRVLWNSASLADARLWFNVTRAAGQLIPYEPLYLVGEISEGTNGDGLFYLDDIWWTQSPSSQSKIYIFIGGVYDCTTSNVRAILCQHNPWYIWNGSKLVEFRYSRIKMAETEIVQTNTQIALKANSADVYTKTQSDGLISTEVTNRNAAISAATDAINLSVSQTYSTKTEVEEVADRIIGRNLLFKTSDGDIYPYEATVSDAYFVDFTYGNKRLGNSFELEEGVTYTFSVDVESNVEPFVISIGAGINSYSRDVANSSNKTSGRISVTFTPTAYQLASGNVFAFRAPRYSSQKTFTFTISKPKLEKGAVATEWSAAPEDYTDKQVTAAKAAIKVTTDGITSEVEKKTDKASIISTINQSAESVKIQASKVDITGEAVFSAINNDTGTTKINGGKIDATAITIGQSQVTGLATALNGKADDSDISAIQDDLNSSRVWYAVCDTVAATVAKVATISPATTDFTLEIGRMVNVRFVNTNTGAVASLTLNINGTGAKPIKNFYNGGINNLSSAGYLKANSIITFKYDGTNWVTDLTVNNTYNQGVSQLYNTIKAKTNITKESIIVGDANGYSMAAAGVSFDLSYPILWTTVNINANGTNYASVYTSYHDRNLATNHGFSSGTPNSIVYLVGTVTGNTFTLASSYITTIVPNSEDGYCYIAIGRLGNQSTGGNYFYFFCVDKPTLYTYKDGLFGPASIREASAAAKTATNYISLDSTGIRIANENPATATTYQHQTAANTEFIVDGVSTAEFSGSGGRIGSYNGVYTVLNNNQLTLAGYANKIFSVEVEDVTPEGVISTNVLPSTTARRASGVTNWYISVNQLWIPFIQSITSSNSTLVENTDYFINKVDGTIYIRNGINIVEINYRGIPAKDYNTSLTLYDGKGIGTNNKLMNISNDSTVIGKTNESHIVLDYHSMQMVDEDGNTYFHVSDLRDKEGCITNLFVGDGETFEFQLNTETTSIKSVKVNGTDVGYTSVSGDTVELATAPEDGAEVEIRFVPYPRERVKAYTLGMRSSGYAIGHFSVAEGYGVISSAHYSHAEGDQSSATGSSSHAEGCDTKASGDISHAEGYITEANGDFSHSQNFFTVAGSDYQTAIGKYNDNNSTNAFEIGNGTATNARSNALAVDWDGNIKAQGALYIHNGRETFGGTSDSLLLQHKDANDAEDFRIQFYIDSNGHPALRSSLDGGSNWEYPYANQYASRTANTVWAAPNGSAGAASFRALVAADIPNLNASKITAGSLDIPGSVTSDGAITSGAAIYAHDGQEIFGGTDALIRIYHRASGSEDFRFDFYIDGNGNPAMRASLDAGSSWKYPYLNQLSSRTANTVLAGPNGSNGAPSFRALVADDIPNLNASKITAGTLGTARGGTGVSGRQSSTITVDTSNVTVGDTNHCWHNGVVCSFSYNFKTKASLANNGTLTVGTLPSGYRPPYTFVGSAYTSTASAQADVSISTAGVITIRNVSGAAIATSVTIRVGGTFAL